MDILHELNKFIRRNNTSGSEPEDIIPLDVLLRQPGDNNLSLPQLEGGVHFVKSIPEVVALLVAYTAVIVLSFIGNSLVGHSFEYFYMKSSNSALSKKREPNWLPLQKRYPKGSNFFADGKKSQANAKLAPKRMERDSLWQLSPTF